MYQSVEDGVEAAFGCEAGPRLFCSTKTRLSRDVPLLLALCLFSMQILCLLMILIRTQLAFTFSTSAMETPGQLVKSVQSQQ